MSLKIILNIKLELKFKVDYLRNRNKTLKLILNLKEFRNL